MLTGAALENEVELIGDGDGLAVIGNPSMVERFMATHATGDNVSSGFILTDCVNATLQVGP